MSETEKIDNIKETNSLVQDLIVVVDESGSMQTMGGEPVQAINNFIEEQQTALVDGASFTLWKFNSVVTKVIDDEKLKDVKKFSNYLPNGMTALFDAVGMAISTKLAKDKSTGVVCLIVTDGVENASIKYNKSQVATMIKEMEEKNNWKFVFLGANQDVFKQGGNIGMDMQRCAAFSACPGDLLKVARQASENIAAYRSLSAKATPTDLSIKRATSEPNKPIDFMISSHTTTSQMEPPKLVRQHPDV